MRVALGEPFGLQPGENVLGKTVSLLKKLGFAHVVDTPLGADIATYYEAADIKEMLEKGTGKFPIFNSCCIGWRLYAAKMHPELLSHITIIASPQMTIGAVAKYYIAQKLGIDVDKIVIVGVMPCALKKYETMEVMRNGHKYVDYVVTTVELAQWAKKKQIDFLQLPDESLSDIMPHSSKDGMIFGVTGGMTEAVVTTLAEMLGERKEVLDFRDDGEIRRKKIKVGNHILNMAVVYGLQNFEKIYEEIKAGEVYHFVEIMMCTYGCVGGPGQPITPKEKIHERGKALRKLSDGIKEKTPMDNPTLMKLKKEFLDKLGKRQAARAYLFQQITVALHYCECCNTAN